MKNKVSSTERTFKITGILLLVILVFVSLISGRYPLTLEEILRIILGKSTDETSRQVFLTLRLPRTIMAVVAGGALSIAGGIYQNLFKNPLATPDIIGVSSGASLGAAFAILFLGGFQFMLPISAFIGGILTVLLVFLLSRMSRESEILSFIVSGIVVSALVKGILMTLKYFADPQNQLAAIEYWTMGSLSAITEKKVLLVLPLVAVSLFALYLLRWKISVLSLSDDEAASLGVAVGRTRLTVILFSTMLVSSVISVTGPVGFIGLISPHLTRRLLKRNDFGMILLSGILGAVIMLTADILAKSLGTSEIPVSIFTTFIGAPYLAFLLISERRRG